jgi:hypothetical protein
MQLKGNSGLWRRVRLYGYGFIIGLLGVYLMFGGKGCQSLTPGMLKLNDLANHTKVLYSDTAACQMICQHIDTNEVKESFTYGVVDSKKSQDFNVRHPLYNFSGQTRSGRKLNIICMEFDTITRVIYIHDIAKKDTCKCP